ncbi:MAG: class I SAM-dependent methyltransferase [Aquificota bacterium]
MNLEESILVEEAENCLLCGKKGKLMYKDLRDRLFNAPGTWSLMHCPQCDFMWLNPRPIEDEVGKLYQSYFTHKPIEPSKKKFVNFRKTLKAKILNDTLGYDLDVEYKNKGLAFLVWLLSKIGPLKELVSGSLMWLRAEERGKLLDIGCGNGYFLAQMRDLGWDVAGVEPDPNAVKVAREEFGLKVFQGTIEEINFPENSFDVITMNHVIEHVLDPIALLSECKRILKPNGKLIVITPNIKSLGHRFFKQDWRGLEPPRHIYLFSSRSLITSAEKAGLKVKKVFTPSKGAYFIWLASRIIKRDGNLPGRNPEIVSKSYKLEALLFWELEYLLTKFWQVGEEIVMEAGK